MMRFRFSPFLFSSMATLPKLFSHASVQPPPQLGMELVCLLLSCLECLDLPAVVRNDTKSAGGLDPQHMAVSIMRAERQRKMQTNRGCISGRFTFNITSSSSFYRAVVTTLIYLRNALQEEISTRIKYLELIPSTTTPFTWAASRSVVR